jgi:cell division protein FtsI/penicillin-binding protein 2
LIRRAFPLAGLAALALALGLYVGSRQEDPGRRAAERFARAYERGDFRAMHAALAPTARRRASVRRLQRSYGAVARTATIVGVDAGRPVAIADRDGATYALRVDLRTRAFGTITRRLRLPITDAGDADRAGVDWTAALAFPGLRRGERLTRETELAPRAALLARDGTPLAEGPQRLSELGPLAAEVVGRIGPIPPERAAAYDALGVPRDASVGLNGLEREFDERLLGRPGGTLRAGGRTLVQAPPRPGTAVRTSISPAAQRAAVEALAGRFGGIAVLRPGTGEVLALAGIAFSAPQPPGSTFKIVTLAGALDAGAVRRSDDFPRVTNTVLEGVELENANREVCGGSLAESFAESCNSVFAPLGAKLGAPKLVAAAERFGFNETPTLRGAARSTIPPARQIGDDLAVGSTAIGQGKLLATPLLMASVAATIAQDGRRRRPSLMRGGADAAPVQATSRRTARTIGRYMRRVVRSGTGTAAAIEGVSVAGKTGTAELRDTTQDAPATGLDVAPGAETQNPAADTDAWFTAYAPATRPRVAVAVLLVGQGAGGETAAPAAKIVLQAALKD